MLLIAIGSLPLLASPALGADPAHKAQGFEAKPLLKATQTTIGDPLMAPASGEVEITAVIGTIDSGGHSALHTRPVPTFVARPQAVLRRDFAKVSNATARTMMTPMMICWM